MSQGQTTFLLRYLLLVMFWSWDLLARRHNCKEWCLCVISKLKVFLLGWNQSSSNVVLAGALSNCSMCGSALSV